MLTTGQVPRGRTVRRIATGCCCFRPPRRRRNAVGLSSLKAGGGLGSRDGGVNQSARTAHIVAVSHTWRCSQIGTLGMAVAAVAVVVSMHVVVRWLHVAMLSVSTMPKS